MSQYMTYRRICPVCNELHFLRRAVPRICMPCYLSIGTGVIPVYHGGLSNDRENKPD